MSRKFCLALIFCLLAALAAPASGQTPDDALAALAVTLSAEATSDSYASLYARINELEVQEMEGLAVLLDDGLADGPARNLVLDRLGWLPFALTADGFFVGNPDLRHSPDFEILTVDGETVLAFASADIVHQPGEVPVSDAPMRFWLRGAEQNHYEAVKYEILPPPPADLAERVEEMTLLAAGMYREPNYRPAPTGFWERFKTLERSDLEIMLGVLQEELDGYYEWCRIHGSYEGDVYATSAWGGRIINGGDATGPRGVYGWIKDIQDRLGILPFDLVVEGRFLGFTSGGGTGRYNLQIDNGQIFEASYGSVITVGDIDDDMSSDDRWRFWFNDYGDFYGTLKRQSVEQGRYAGREIPESWRYEWEH